MTKAYRDERDAALARVDALLRENATLRAENGWLHAHHEGAHGPPARVRGALAAAPLMLAAIACAGLVVRDASTNAARADAELAYAPAAMGPTFTVPDARASLRTLVRDGEAPVTSPPPTVARTPAEVVASAVTPLLQGCFTEPSPRVDVLAAVDARGRTRHAHVFVEGRASRSLRAEKRCVRRALATVTLPTARADYAPATGPVHLVVLPAPTSHHRRRAR